MSSIRVSSGYKTDSIKCTKCGRKYSKNTSATRQQYFCSSCGADLPYPKQDEKKPLLPESGHAQKQNNKTKRIGFVISVILIFVILITIYILFINPSTSIISESDEPIHHFNTTSPTTDPTVGPTMPSISPTMYPTGDPTTNPTKYPTMYPTIYPTESPTVNPTLEPTKGPTKEPTLSPTDDPTQEPTGYPSVSPTIDPTNNPTINPSPHPTTNPSVSPTIDPTIDPTEQPSHSPSKSPTKAPTNVIQSAPFVMGMSIGAATIAVLILICIVAFVMGKKKGYNQYKKQRKHDERMISHDKAEADADYEDHQSDIVMA